MKKFWHHQIEVLIAEITCFASAYHMHESTETFKIMIGIVVVGFIASYLYARYKFRKTKNK
ncbi:hypothetical protein [uncultured Lactobacillus sp.]|uniref:hypothetical protein n=1 Tax=uncultured Lactobacillus sp. TaxID=153152 RepID=UPI002803B7A3|nr:hypothetical protein [uncultured Lactobacillus sp.]